LDTASGDVLWTYTTAGLIHAAVALAGGALYVATVDGQLYALH
jgi:outer membrane protein assembly factor BamB